MCEREQQGPTGAPAVSVDPGRTEGSVGHAKGAVLLEPRAPASDAGTPWLERFRAGLAPGGMTPDFLASSFATAAAPRV